MGTTELPLPVYIQSRENFTSLKPPPKSPNVRPDHKIPLEHLLSETLPLMCVLLCCNKSITPNFFGCRCISASFWLATVDTSSGKFCCCCILQNYQILSILTYEISSTSSFLGILQYWNFKLNSRFTVVLVRTFPQVKWY